MNNLAKFNVAFVGGAYHSAVGRVHRIATEMDQRFRLVAGCFSTHHSANQESAALYGVDIHRCYANAHDLLIHEKSNIDALVVLTPTTNHFETISMAIEHSIPVISEKALVSDLKEATKIHQLIKEQASFLRVTYNYTGYPMLRELKEMICEGKLGKLSEIHIEMPQEGFSKLNEDNQPITPQTWRLKDGDIPTLSLDLGVHVHSIIKFLSGADPIDVVATNKTYGNFNQIIDSISCLAQYSDDILCQVWFSKAALGHRNGLKVRVYGDAGSAEWYQDNPEYILFADAKGRKITLDRASPEIKVANLQRYNRFKAGHPAGFIEAFANAYYDLADELSDPSKHDEHPYTFGIDDVIQGLKMLKAMQQSAQDRRWVNMCEVES